MAIEPRQVSALGLLALVPMVAYMVGRAEWVVVLALVCVGVIVGSLYYMFSASDVATGAFEQDHEPEEPSA